MEGEFLKYVGAGLACTGMIGAAIGVGLCFSAYINGLARNPSMDKKMSTPAYVGAGMAEALGLFALVIAFMCILKI